jgi:hypothetical protein
MTAPAPKTRAPVEAKTQAAGVTAAVAGAIVWVLQQYVFKGTVAPGLVSLIYVAVPGALAFAAAWLAPHTSRPAAVLPTVPATGNVTTIPPAT